MQALITDGHSVEWMIHAEASPKATRKNLRGLFCYTSTQAQLHSSQLQESPQTKMIKWKEMLVEQSF